MLNFCKKAGRTPLIVSQSPVANQERAFIQQQIAAGKSKSQIKAALVEEYGDQVLAEPGGDGFDATLWIVPIALVLLGAVGIFFAAGTSGPAGAMVANLTRESIRSTAFGTLTLANNLLGLAAGPLVTGIGSSGALIASAATSFVGAGVGWLLMRRPARS